MTTPEPATTPKTQPVSTSSFIAETIRTTLIVIVVVFLLRTFLVQPFVVEGSSMYPRLTTKDYLLVDKLSYHFSEPQRGDVIVFRYPFRPDENYVKRIIGLPGEQIKFADNGVYVINATHPEGMKLDETAYLNAAIPTQIAPGGEQLVTVQPNTYFVMGDNRPASSDSREWGLLPDSYMIGRVALRAYPLSHFAIIQHARYSL